MDRIQNITHSMSQLIIHNEYLQGILVNSNCVCVKLACKQLLSLKYESYAEYSMTC